MNKIIKIISVSLLFIITVQNAIADEVVISENFIKHPYCDNIKKVVLKTKKSSKTTLFEMLKKTAKEFGGNAVINTNYEVGYFGTKSVEGIIAKCNVQNSPELFVKSSDMISFKTKDVTKEDIKITPINLFGMVSVLNDSVTMDKTNNGVKTEEIQSSAGIGVKTGIIKNNFRYYANINISTGNVILASADYIYNINSDINLYGGISLGVAQYKLSDSSTINGMAKGVQIALQYKEYELGYQKLNTDSSVMVENTKYELKDISFVYLAYHF